ncbi:MAG TPA: aldo/keto reductase [Jiangellaceae bacterium]
MTSGHVALATMDISRVGFGAWAIGGGGWRFGWGGQDDDESVAAIRAAVEQGVNWIDTAAVYGLGHSEEIVARAIADLPAANRPYLFTKAGLVWDEDDRSAAPRRVMDPASVRREVEASLRRLSVEQIDLYQVHWPPAERSLEYAGAGSTTGGGTPLEEYWQVMADLKQEGKVAAIGLSNHDTEQLDRAEAVAHVDAIQPPFSAINRSAAAEIAWAHAHGTGVIVYSPMQSGLLTGAFSAERVAGLPHDDWRRDHADFTTGLSANLAVVETLREVANRHDATIASVAVAWALAWPGVTAAIVGARRPDQVTSWAGANSLVLEPKDLDEIAESLVATGAGSGPVRP